MKSILITGSSTGIGAAICEHFSDIGWRVFGSVRNIKDGEKLAEICGENFIPLIFDVTDINAIKEAKKLVESNLVASGLDCLVNNAGINISGPMEYVDSDELFLLIVYYLPYVYLMASLMMNLTYVKQSFNQISMFYL